MNERELIVSSSETNLAEIIKKELTSSDTCIIISAFIGRGLHNMLVRQIEKSVDAGKTVKILTSTMNNFNDPEVIRSFQQRASELRIYGSRQGVGAFHVKSYIFLSREDGDQNVIILGSSNFTQMGLTRNREWNILLRGDHEVLEKALKEFEGYWNDESFVPDEDFYTSYRKNYRPIAAPQEEMFPTDTYGDTPSLQLPQVIPNTFQEEALSYLRSFREQEIDKALVVAATGTGKTYLAAMDFKQSGYGRILFVAHRENILENARGSLENVLGHSIRTGLITGKTPQSEYRPNPNTIAVFAMVRTLSNENVLDAFPPDYFDYIVIDEFHHASASTYQKVLEHFTPRFLLGLTATPERMDGRDVFSICDYNIAHEIRLFDAIEQDLLVPFYYFAIYDEVDYSEIRWTGIRYNTDDLENLLKSDTRARLVLHNLEKYLPSGGVKTKALGFCVNTGHAQFMKERFEELEKKAEVVLGTTPEEERSRIISRLTDEHDPLEVIFSVDVFTEGVDIPELTHILLLRPTESFTIFQQQIGRGLRKHKLKSFVIILDFIGNYRSSFIPFLALRGITAAKDVDLQQLIEEEPRVPSVCHVDEHTELRKIQRQQLQDLFKKGKRKNYRDFYLEIYRQVRSEIDHPLSILEFFDHPLVEEMEPFRKFIEKSWLRIKEAASDLSDYEKQLLNGPGEDLLYHIEQKLKPNRSYKMVVLNSLVEKEATPEGWNIEEIAQDFKNFYLQNRHYLADYTDMARASNPVEFSLSEVKKHIINMPLFYLSNDKNKFFQLDEGSGRFFLKEGANGILHRLWNDQRFKQLLRDHITFALKTYFYRKNT